MVSAIASDPSEAAVKNLCGGGDNHRYNVEVDDTMIDAITNGDGKVYVYGIDSMGGAGFNKHLNQSPRVFNNFATTGYLDVVDYTSIYGWACDKDDPSKSIDVVLHIGGPAGSASRVVSVTASESSESAVSRICGGGDNHRFSVEVDDTIMAALSEGDGKVYAHGLDTLGNAEKNSQLHQSPRAMANHHATQGYLDVVDYTTIYGWACDKDEPYKSIAVHLYFGGPAGSGTHMISAMASDSSEAAVKDLCGGGDNHRFSIEMDELMLHALLEGDGKVYVYGLDTLGAANKNSQLRQSPKALKTDFAVRDCTIESVIDEIGLDKLKVMLSTENIDEIESSISMICSSAWEEVPSVPFTAVDERFTNDFMGEYVAGDTFLNTETGTFQGTVEGENISAFRNNEAKNSVVKAFPEINTCNHNSIMCCFGRDRQPNDNNGNCADPIDTKCINADPADNSNLCFTDHDNHPFPGRDEGQIHCHGLAWADDENAATAQLKYNNFFYVSLYDHMYTRGYVENMVDSEEVPMCGCIEDMPPVSRADCTEISTNAVFILEYVGPSLGLSGYLSNYESLEAKFNACRGINPSNGNRANNDLASYVHRLQLENKISIDAKTRVFETLVGYDQPGNNNNEEACAAAYEAKTGLVYPENNFAATGYLDSVAYGLVLGWACDQDEPTTSVGVHIYFGGPAGSGSPAAAIIADESSEAAVGDRCGGGDNHRFSFQMDESMVDATLDGDGKVYVYALDTLGGEGKNRPLGASPKSFNTFATQGYLDSAGGGVIRGWACDKDEPSESINVHIYFGGPAANGGHVVSAIASDPSEAAVKNLCGGGDNHRFSIEADETMIDAIKSGDGKVYVYGMDTWNDAGKNSQLNHSPKLANQHNPQGYLDSVNDRQIRGWACDKDEPSKSIEVKIYFGGPAGTGAYMVSAIASDPSEAAVKNLCGGGDNHRYNVEVDDTMIDAITNGDGKVYVYGIDSMGGAGFNKHLNQSPRVFNNFATTGYLDVVDYTSIYGWACDKDDPSKSIDVVLHIGGPAGSASRVVSVTASESSESAVSRICGGGDNHRFSVEVDDTIMAALSEGDGKVYAHGLDTLGNAEKNSQLHQSPRAMANHHATQGYLDVVDYTTIYGWACDKDEPYKSIAVHLYFGGPAGSGTHMISAMASDSSEAAVKDLCGGGDNHRFSIEMDELMLHALLEGDGKVYVYGLDTLGAANKNSQLRQSPKALKTDFAVRDCTIESVIDEIGLDKLKVMLSTENIDEIESSISMICSSAWEEVPSVPFTAVDERFTNDFMGEYVAGDTFLNTETGTFQGTVEGENISAFRNNEAKNSVVKAFPEINTCNHNSIMCCFGRDRQPNDNNGNCADPIDTKCINADPADNSNLCFTDHDNHPFPGRDEGQIHCHGLAWADDENAATAQLKYNNFFYVSLYDHMYTRGYVENMVDSEEVPMCGCIEDMPPVSRADCTEISTNAVFILEYVGPSLGLSGYLSNYESLEAKFNACRGINPSNGNRANNDLASYVHRLQLENKISIDAKTRVFETLVGYDQPGNNNNEEACAAAYEAKTGLVYPENNFAATGYLDSVAYGLVLGWACDQDEPTTSVGVHIYFGGPAGSGSPAAAIIADESSEAAVGDRCGGGDNHRFSFQMDESMVDATLDGDGKVYVYALDTLGGEGKNRPLGASPKSFNTFATQGYLDSAGGGVIRGWACDKDEPSESINVHIYFGGPAANGGHVVSAIASDPSEAAVKNLCGGGDNHRFSIEADETMIDAIKSGDGKVYVYGMDTWNDAEKNSQLNRSPKLY